MRWALRILLFLIAGACIAAGMYGLHQWGQSNGYRRVMDKAVAEGLAQRDFNHHYTWRKP